MIQTPQNNISNNNNFCRYMKFFLHLHAICNNVHNNRKMKFILSILIAGLLLVFVSCNKDEDTTTPPSLQLELGGAYVADSAVLAINDTIQFAVHAAGISSNLTYFKVDVVTESGTSTIYSEGLNSKTLDVVKVFYKGIAEKETYVITVMDYNRNSATASFTVFKDSASGYGAIHHFANVIMGYQNNSAYGHFLDPFTGDVFDNTSVSGHESEVHIIPYFYLSSGTPSPTLVCPAQTDAQTQYPIMASWAVQNATLYDYHTSDYNLISAAQFDACSNDSLLLAAYNPTYVNQKCKFATAGKIIPFLTANGKKGLIKVVAADEVDTGTITLDIKIQQ